jgi:hypothetical protein
MDMKIKIARLGQEGAVDHEDTGKVRKNIPQEETHQGPIPPLSAVPSYNFLSPKEYYEKASEIKKFYRDDKEEYVFKNGDIYNGEWIGNERDGFGEQKWADGNEYKGQWLDNKPFGHGTLRLKTELPNGQEAFHIYEGEIIGDEPYWQGRFINATGAVYDGQWDNNLPHGKGIEIWPDNTKYEGDYELGFKHGKGKFFFADNSIYKGRFDKDVISGRGTYTKP